MSFRRIHPRVTDFSLNGRSRPDQPTGFSRLVIEFQTVLDTQRTQLRTQESVASTRIALSADHVRLYKALGGGWRPEDRAVPSTQDASQATRS